MKNISEYARVGNYAYKVMKRLLPGPYTFVLEASRQVPKILQTRRRTVGIISGGIWAQQARLGVSEVAESSIPARSVALSGDGGDIVEQALKHLEHDRAFSLDETLRAWERGYIQAALRLTRGNVSQAAKLLGINRTTLYSRMQSSADQK